MARRVPDQINKQLVTFARLANGRFTNPLKDTDTCPAGSHKGGGIRWGPAGAALAATALVGVMVGVAASPDPTPAVAVVSPSPSPQGTDVVPFSPIKTSSPSPSPTPTPISTVIPSDAPVEPVFSPQPTPPPIVIVVQAPPVQTSSGGASSVITRRIETTRVVREVVERPSVTIICLDPGRHLGRSCRVVR